MSRIPEKDRSGEATIFNSVTKSSTTYKMENKLARIISFVLNPVAYFGITYFVTKYLFRHQKPSGASGEVVAVIGPGILLLAAITYMGVWICIAQKSFAKFKQPFLLLAVCPAVVGFVAATLGSFR